MDFACTFQHPNAVGVNEGARSRIHQWDASLKSRWRSSFSSFRGNATFETHHKKKLKKRTVSGARFNCSTLITGELDGQLWRRGLSGARVGNSFATSLAISRLCCQGSDSVAYIDGNNQDVELVESGESIKADNNTSSENGSGKEVREEDKLPSLDELRELLLKALNELEVARLNSTMFEEKAQKISETAIALKDEATNALNDVNATLDIIQETVNEEIIAKESVQKATMALSLAEARVQVAMDSLEAENRRNVMHESSIESQSETESVVERLDSLREKEETLLIAQRDIRECRVTLVNCELDLERLQCRKEELQKELDRLREAAETAEENALKAEEDVANIMLLAEQAVAIELEAAKCLSDAEIALQQAEKNLPFQIDSPEIASHQIRSSSQGYVSSEDSVTEDEWASEKMLGDIAIGREGDERLEAGDSIPLSQFDGTGKGLEESILPSESDHENGKLSSESLKDIELDPENSKTMGQTAKHESQKDFTRDGLPLQKALSKKSSRFSEFTPASLFQGLTEFSWKQLPKLVVGALLIGAGMTLFLNKKGRINQLFPQREVISSSIDRVSTSIEPLLHQVQKLPKNVKKLMEMLPHQEINEEEASLFDVLWLLLASVVFVPIFQKIPGGSPVLGYLAAGILIGPYGLSIIRHVHGTKAIAEFGVVFLLFNIGLELSVERLSSMKKYVFGLGSAQVLVTAAVFGFLAHLAAGQPGPAAIVIGNGLALSSTAVVLQVLQERGESTSRHGRATFSVLLFQDLAVVVLLILIPLISPNSSKGGVMSPTLAIYAPYLELQIGFQAIAEALGLAAVKAVVAISAIVAGGRLLLRPIYKQIAENQNAEIFSANSLLVILGTSLLTARAGLSMALGAFLAGLLLAETEFSIQIESDIAPYRGLLLGLFFMTVGMSIDPKLLISNFPVIMGALALLIGGKTILIVGVSRLFGISIISAIRAGLLLAPGGEFAFVAFGEAVNQGIMSSELSSLLFLVVGISMALTPWLAAGGQLIASRFGLHDVRSLLPVESETEDLQDHIIICGFGRVGQIIAQLLSERRIPFVALDVRSDQVAIGRKLDLPVYFGDAGSREVLHKIGAERACAAAITLDTPGANYRTVWALNKYFPNVKTFVRAHDVDHGLNLEKAGATAVVPETLEPSLQLAAAVLAQAKLPMSEIATAINEFRSRHLSELTELCQSSGSSLGYGFSSVLSKTKSQSSESSDDNQTLEGTIVL